MISVIVPIYNVEPYLHKCIDSILAQTFTDFECILVDDASPDNSPYICDEYAKRDNRFKVIHKKINEGLPKARKTGLDLSTGEFVMHVDSDDWIHENAIEVLLKKQHETNADIVIGSYKILFPNRETVYSPTNIKKYNFPLDALFYVNQIRYLWGKLYKKNCFDDYIVPEFNIGEDVMVNVQIFKCREHKNIAVINDIIYYYNRAVNSNMTAPKKIICNNYYDYPRIIPRLWVKKYLIDYNIFSKVENSFTFDFLQYGVFSFMRYSKKISKNDINLLYKNYYVPFKEKKKLSIFCKTLIVLYKKSLLLGSIYSNILNLISTIRNGNA